MRIVMIDLETMGQGSHAAIASIGAVAFDPYGVPPKLGDDSSFSVTVSLEGQEEGIDAETLYWWLGQGNAAREALRHDPKPMSQSLVLFRHWCLAQAPDFAMAYGAAFDFPILNNAFKRLGLTSPIHYREGLCLRTLTRLFPCRVLRPRRGVVHSALDDAYNQALWCQRIYQTHITK